MDNLQEIEAGLIVSFDDQSESFTHGFEAGIIWKRMMDGEPVIEGCNGMMCHAANETVLKHMAASQGYDISASAYDDEWFMPVFTKARSRFSVISGGLQ